MKTAPSMLTLFHEFQPALMHKDVGSLPYFLASGHGWRVALACFGCEDEFRAPDALAWRQHVTLLTLGSRGGMLRNAARIGLLLWRQRGRYGVFNYYHDSGFMLVYALLYKLLNPGGRVYCKLDIGAIGLARVKQEQAEHVPLAVRLHHLFSRYVVDCYSTETEEIFQQLKMLPYFARRLYYIPNGFSCPPVDIEAVLRNKERIILTAGNLGSYAKNNELLLAAVAALPPELLRGWKVVLAGPMVNADFYEAGFRPDTVFAGYVRGLLARHPHLRDVVVLAGNIDDRREMDALFCRARIFCLTSRYEGFPHVILEALYFGCALIATDLTACREATEDGVHGTLFPSEDLAALVAGLQSAMTQKEDVLHRRGLAGHCRVAGHYAWRSIALRLSAILQGER